MRMARIRYDREMCYYHLMNRVAGEAGYFPFGDVEKEKLFQLSVQVARFYSLDLLSFVCMGNHWHAVCAAPAEPPSRDEVIANWQAAKGKLAIEPNWDDAETVANLGARMRDISCFVKDLQQRFTCWFNRTRLKRRRGGLWAGRFKGVILEGCTALWDCLTYVEMNPVRAGLAEAPGDYRLQICGHSRPLAFAVPSSTNDHSTGISSSRIELPRALVEGSADSCLLPHRGSVSQPRVGAAAPTLGCCRPLDQPQSGLRSLAALTST